LLQLSQFEHYKSEGRVMRYHCFFIALVLVPLSPLSAQVSQSLEPGTRVRVSTAPVGLWPDWMVGTIISVTDDHLIIRPERDSAQSIELARTALTHLEVSHGKRSKWLTGLGLGFLGGAAVGAAVGYNSGGYSDILGPEAFAAIVAIPSALGGALIGGVIGAVIKVDRWQVVPRVTVGRLDPADFHVQFLVSLRIGR
jgi:hypothetical protein